MDSSKDACPGSGAGTGELEHEESLLDIKALTQILTSETINNYAGVDSESATDSYDDNQRGEFLALLAKKMRETDSVAAAAPAPPPVNDSAAAPAASSTTDQAEDGQERLVLVHTGKEYLELSPRKRIQGNSKLQRAANSGSKETMVRGHSWTAGLLEEHKLDDLVRPMPHWNEKQHYVYGVTAAITELHIDKPGTADWFAWTREKEQARVKNLTKTKSGADEAASSTVPSIADPNVPEVLKSGADLFVSYNDAQLAEALHDAYTESRVAKANTAKAVVAAAEVCRNLGSKLSVTKGHEKRLALADRLALSLATAMSSFTDDFKYLRTRKLKHASHVYTTFTEAFAANSDAIKALALLDITQEKQVASKGTALKINEADKTFELNQARARDRHRRTSSRNRTTSSLSDATDKLNRELNLDPADRTDLIFRQRGNAEPPLTMVKWADEVLSKSLTRGGLCGDGIGTGKTIEYSALILRNSLHSHATYRQLAESDQPLPDCRPWLVLTLASLVGETAIAIHRFAPEHFKVVAVKGKNLSLPTSRSFPDSLVEYSRLCHTDSYFDPTHQDNFHTIVVMSYHTFASHHGPIAQAKWEASGGSYPDRKDLSSGKPGGNPKQDAKKKGNAKSKTSARSDKQKRKGRGRISEDPKIPDSNWALSPRHKFAGIVLDEPQFSLRNANRHRLTVEWADASEVWLFTGSPAPRGLRDYGSYLKLISRGDLEAEAQRLMTPKTIPGADKKIVQFSVDVEGRTLDESVNVYELQEDDPRRKFAYTSAFYSFWIGGALDEEDDRVNDPAKHHKDAAFARGCLKDWIMRRDGKSRFPRETGDQILSNLKELNHYEIETLFSPSAQQQYEVGVEAWTGRFVITDDITGKRRPNPRAGKAVSAMELFPPLRHLHVPNSRWQAKHDAEQAVKKAAKEKRREENLVRKRGKLDSGVIDDSGAHSRLLKTPDGDYVPEKPTEEDAAETDINLPHDDSDSEDDEDEKTDVLRPQGDWFSFFWEYSDLAQGFPQAAGQDLPQWRYLIRNIVSTDTYKEDMRGVDVHFSVSTSLFSLQSWHFARLTSSPAASL
ncbi:hypothetical protein C7974DRAFT_454703 [Boeremia exigua]|uniref:uncharacterized protein n=1 Tax=Boeremia exigua TaxID=749465 RepID=UPI001E8EC722|nr:uncharacterized protein C7974DRAFT_454703 [Boeremia exigua]KAH6629789.1 hypothetical protein C7974DRAFT_454703 [Boeremia exigua]